MNFPAPPPAHAGGNTPPYAAPAQAGSNTPSYGPPAHAGGHPQSAPPAHAAGYPGVPPQAPPAAPGQQHAAPGQHATPGQPAATAHHAAPGQQVAPGQHGSAHAPAHAAPHGQAAQPGFIQFTVQGNFWTSTMVTPTVTFNGHHVPVVNHGTTTIPVQPGTYVIDVHIKYLWNFGRAALQVQVQPGQTVPVFYGPPWVTWSPGSLGVVPQQRRGLGWFIGLVCVPLAALLFTFGMLLMMIFTL